MEKKLCPTHRFMYIGQECPFCVQDRVDAMVRKAKRYEKREERQDKELDGDTLRSLLSEKFNVGKI